MGNPRMGENGIAWEGVTNWDMGNLYISVWVAIWVYTHVKNHQAVNLRFMQVTHLTECIFTAIKIFNGIT